MSSYRERRGAHRPAGLGPAGTIPWLVAAVLVIGVVAYGLGWIGGGSGGDEAGPSTTPASTSSQHTSSQSTKSPKATTTSSPTSSSTSTPSGTVHPTQQVTVLNGTRTSGLASGAASRLRTAGWTIRSTGNFRGAVTATTVFYGSASLQATAAAVAKDVGATTVQESGDFGASAVTVVLADDYRP